MNAWVLSTAAVEELKFLGLVESDEGVASASPADFEWDGYPGWWVVGEKACVLFDLRASEAVSGLDIPQSMAFFSGLRWFKA